MGELSGINVQHLFSAPILSFAWKDMENLNDELGEIILARRREFPSERMTNAGGWQSAKDLHTWGGKAVQELLTKIDIAVYMISSQCFGEEALDSLKEKWCLAAWANVNEKGDYNNLHNHTGGIWSGVYYVSPGSEDPDYPLSGVITFKNPTLAPLAIDNLKPPVFIREFFRSEYSLRPQPGQMILFPSWLEHQVHPYFGQVPRISVSWDVIFSPSV